MNELTKILPKHGELTATGWNLPETITKQEWVDIGKKFNAVSGAVQWAWGDWWNAGNWEHGERKAMVESDEWNGPAYKTLSTYGEICSKFDNPTRVGLLTFRHHQECVGLPIEEAEKLLNTAEEYFDKTGKQMPIRVMIDNVKRVKAWLAQGWNTDQIERKEMVEAGYTVVANQKDDVDSALIAWADQQGKMVEIGRNTKWGNPFELGKDGNRDTVCENYKLHYVPHKPSIYNDTDNLRGKVLVCWCYPERCHGDHLKELANEA